MKFFNKVRSGEHECNFNHLLHTHNFLTRTLPLWTREFVCHYTPLAATAYMDAVTANVPDTPADKSGAKDHMNWIVNNLSGLLRRYYVPAKYQSMVNYLNTAIGSTLIDSKNLEKRIQGVKMIVDQIKEARSSGYSRHADPKEET